ncbi:putative phosphoesterase [Devosia enhydra]|uniref:Putative phosphoesterase n=2 Tax=Devosia enhydra TaxID=665118 RepID=A0A1K2I214_9HYPH|nr:putative phosphoesterase [Devosia enhydra]
MRAERASKDEAGYQETDTVMLRFAGETFEPLPSGALFWRAENALLVADLHLEKFSSYARRGQLLPPYDTAMTLRRLAADVARTGASHVVALGDSFHRDEGVETLLPADRARLGDLTARADFTWLAGNHDPRPHALGGTCRPVLSLRGLTLAHEPRRAQPGLVAGHLHPAAHVHINGRSVRRPCFVHDGRLMILPAYGAATGAINILGPAFTGLFDHAGLEVVMLGRDRLYPVGRRRLVLG